MTTHLQSFEIDGQTVWVEVDDLTVTSPTRSKTEKTDAGSAASGALAKIESLDIAKTLKAIVSPVRSALDAAKPDEISVEVSLGIKGEVGVFVAKSEGNASIKVTAKWKLEAPKAASTQSS
ncbi:hypothetical protein DBR42_27660 [Pelomonas sp. HMWF004]|nr:hypothetical protein DBR42_27660 [Pelomonas sp. HMWF004]